MNKLLKAWKRYSSSEKIFLIWSIIIIGILFHATKFVNVINEDIAFGVVISWLMYMVAYIFYLWISLLED